MTYTCYVFICGFMVSVAELGETLESLTKQIKENLKGGAAIFFEREFNFFHKITDISRLIKPFPKGTVALFMTANH